MSGKKLLFPLLTWMFLTVLVGFPTCILPPHINYTCGNHKWYTLISWNPSVNDLNFLAKQTCLVKYNPIHSNSINGLLVVSTISSFILWWKVAITEAFFWSSNIFQPSNSFFKKGRWFLGVLCCLWVKQRRFFLLSNPGVSVVSF